MHQSGWMWMWLRVFLPSLWNLIQEMFIAPFLPEKEAEEPKSSNEKGKVHSGILKNIHNMHKKYGHCSIAEHKLCITKNFSKKLHA